MAACVQVLCVCAILSALPISILTHDTEKCVTTARRTAWYKEEDVPCPDYNPFRKIHRPLVKPGDEEDTTGLTNPDVRPSETRSAVLKGPGNGETITMPSTTESASRDSVTPSTKYFSHEEGYYSDDTECQTDIVPGETGNKKSRKRKLRFLQKPKQISSCKKNKQKFSAAGQLKASILNA